MQRGEGARHTFLNELESIGEVTLISNEYKPPFLLCAAGVNFLLGELFSEWDTTAEDTTFCCPSKGGIQISARVGFANVCSKGAPGLIRLVRFDRIMEVIPSSWVLRKSWIIFGGTEVNGCTCESQHPP